MALGDFMDVRLRGETKPTRVRAAVAGSTVDVDGVAPAKRGETAPDFITVAVRGWTGKVIEEVYFARNEVVSIVNGHESASARRK